MNAASAQRTDTTTEGDADYPLIEARNVFGRISEARTCLSDISLSIDRGQTVAIIGESGCGKTVFMKTLVGLIKPTRGTVPFDGTGCSNGMSKAS